MPASQRWLSQKVIPVRERLIFALNTTDINEAKLLVDVLGNESDFTKLDWGYSLLAAILSF